MSLISVILILASIDCPFLFSLWSSWVLVWQAIFYLNLEFRGIMGLQILLKLFILASFLWHCTGKSAGRFCLITAEAGVEVQISNSALFTPDGRGGSSSFPLCLHWYLSGLHWHQRVGSGLVTVGRWWKSWLSPKPLLTSLSGKERGASLL